LQETSTIRRGKKKKKNSVRCSAKFARGKERERSPRNGKRGDMKEEGKEGSRRSTTFAQGNTRTRKGKKAPFRVDKKGRNIANS